MCYTVLILGKDSLDVNAVRKKRLIFSLLATLLLLCSCQLNLYHEPISCETHSDADSDGICDLCKSAIIVYIDFYAINDLHGKIADASTHPGVDELTTYLKNARKTDEHVILLSTGDMWQGSSESNLTKGLLMTDWMNELDFAAMALGNHEFDWGEEYIEANDAFAEFPFLAINVYDRDTNQLVDYCQPSTVVDCGSLQIGIIGAIGDCYSSIAPDHVQDIYFKTGNELTALIKAESDRLRDEGADFIVYMLHDGYGETKSNSITSVTGGQLSSYYDTSLSDGYVDLVFEGHTHQGYLLRDEYSVYHLQNRGDNKGGISHVEIAISVANNILSFSEVELISVQKYDDLEDDPLIEDLLKKYADELAPANRVVGHNAAFRDRNALRQLAADLYYEEGLERWGDKYEIVLGGGFFSVRDPGYLNVGQVTYSQLQALFPFDNELVLCSVKGSDLRNKFFETNNSNYFISYGQYGADVRNQIDPNATYYVVVDSYTSTYAPNRLTEIERYGAEVYARDLIAEYMENGGLSQ